MDTNSNLKEPFDGFPAVSRVLPVVLIKPEQPIIITPGDYKKIKKIQIKIRRKNGNY